MPVDEVDAVVSDLFERYDVWRMYVIRLLAVLGGCLAGTVWRDQGY